VVTTAGFASIVGWPAIADAKNAALSPLVLSSDLHASPDPQRFVFGIAKGPKSASGPAARVAFVPPGATGKVTVQPVDTTLYQDGLPKGRGVYVVEATFPEPGAWGAYVFTRGKRVPFAVQVNQAPQAPVVGTAAPRAPSPTRADHLGVKPICTRRPQCPLHDVSLSEVIGAGKPVAALFATPALCASQYCGPVLDELLELTARYQDRITFVHIEIYKSNRGVKHVPTVDAWGLPSEPWLFTIDGSGAIRGRVDGAFGREEIAQQLDALISTG
jgi:hypothetical protein